MCGWPSSPSPTLSSFSDFTSATAWSCSNVRLRIIPNSYYISEIHQIRRYARREENKRRKQEKIWRREDMNRRYLLLVQIPQRRFINTQAGQCQPVWW
jgi:hypothetical protein